MGQSIARVTVLGSGTMGRGIAQVAAAAGYSTRLHDVSSEALQAAGRAIERNLDKGVELGKMTAEAARAAKAGLTLHADIASAGDEADLVIEAIPESMRLKIEAFRAVTPHVAPSAIFATNTSALSVTEMGAASDRPDRFIGMHFFNPVHLMRLVEVVKGLQTSAATATAAFEVARRMGKEPVLVNEAPGFVTTRINALIGNEAFRMLHEGVASAADIDQALKLGLNHPMGPFEMIDLVGLDVRLAILEFLHQRLGDRFRPNHLHVQLVRAGRLGKKTGQGVYRYDAAGGRSD
jgi:3-hydroxybutyryl-CoA dehydrogenase